MTDISLARRLFTAVRRSRLGDIRILTRLYREFVVRRHGSSDVRVGEFVIRFDPRDRFIPGKLIVDGGYETKEIELLCSLIQPGDLVLDIGANIGLYTLPMSRAAGEDGMVLAFEPDPDNARILEHNVRVNGCSNVHVLPCALGDREGELELFQTDDNRGNLSFADLNGTGRSVTVKVRCGASVLSELGAGTPTVAKIDVEGAEPLVLDGLGCRPQHVQLEFVPASLRAQGLDPEAFLERLESDGYRLNIIDPLTGQLHEVSALSLLEIANRRKQVYNLMLTRSVA